MVSPVARNQLSVPMVDGGLSFRKKLPGRSKGATVQLSNQALDASRHREEDHGGDQRLRVGLPVVGIRIWGRENDIPQGVLKILLDAFIRKFISEEIRDILYAQKILFECTPSWDSIYHDFSQRFGSWSTRINCIWPDRNPLQSLLRIHLRKHWFGSG